MRRVCQCRRTPVAAHHAQTRQCGDECPGPAARCLSVYAFSTENFKRTAEEIDTLFTLAEAKLDQMAGSPVIRRHRVRVQVLGELGLLPAVGRYRLTVSNPVLKAPMVSALDSII